MLSFGYHRHIESFPCLIHKDNPSRAVTTRTAGLHLQVSRLPGFDAFGQSRARRQKGQVSQVRNCVPSRPGCQAGCCPDAGIGGNGDPDGSAPHSGCHPGSTASPQRTNQPRNLSRGGNSPTETGRDAKKGRSWCRGRRAENPQPEQQKSNHHLIPGLAIGGGVLTLLMVGVAALLLYRSGGSEPTVGNQAAPARPSWSRPRSPSVPVAEIAPAIVPAASVAQAGDNGAIPETFCRRSKMRRSLSKSAPAPSRRAAPVS